MTDIPPVYNIDPATITVLIALKDPTFTDHDGNLVAMTDHMGWNRLTLHADPTDCVDPDYADPDDPDAGRHVSTGCYECLDSWAIDHHVRILVDDHVVWSSEGCPTD
jgi:hypothetical protein